MKKQTHPLSEKVRGSNVRSPSIRKLGKDGPSYTPTEQRTKDRLMRQFSRQAKGYAVAVSAAFREGYEGIDWEKK